jgi:hypothetical protein
MFPQLGIRFLRTGQRNCQRSSSKEKNDSTECSVLANESIDIVSHSVFGKISKFISMLSNMVKLISCSDNRNDESSSKAVIVDDILEELEG